MVYALVFWTSVGGTISSPIKDWRQLMEFEGSTYPIAFAKCIEGAKQLGIPENKFRCIKNR